MKKIKVLWLSNRVLSDNLMGTGTWLSAMAEGLSTSKEITLGNISTGSLNIMTRQDYKGITQWVFPDIHYSLNNGLPQKHYLSNIIESIEKFSPDVVHVWGTELFWGLLSARELIKRPILLELQGVKSAIAKVFSGGLTLKEQFDCIGLKEIIRKTTIPQEQNKFEKWGIFEREIIQGHQFITVQSPWLVAQVRSINGDCQVFRNEFLLQEPFYSASPWQLNKNIKIFCSTSYPSPFKGLHVAIRAIAILKNKYPNIQLRIAGAYPKKGLRQDGFVGWILNESRKLGVESNLLWLGPLTVDEIIDELQNCSVNLTPTFVEGYCLALAEALFLGVPSVVSFTGGTSYLAKDEDTALFFPPGDHVMCAYQVERLLTDTSLVERLSYSAREVALVRNNPEQIIRNQVSIYRSILEAKK